MVNTTANTSTQRPHYTTQSLHRLPPSGSGAGMMAVIERAQTLGVDVGIDLGGRDVGVSEHHLHGSEIGAVLEQVGGEAVAEHMWGELWYPHAKTIVPEVLPESLPAERAAPAVDKHPLVAALCQTGPRLGEVGSLPTFRPDRRRGPPRSLLPLPVTRIKPVSNLNCGRGETGQLTDSHPGGIEQLQHRLVSEPERRLQVRRGQQGFDLRF